MTDIPFMTISAFSITLAVIIGLVRLKCIYQAYQPFVIILSASLLSELMGHYLVYQGKSNAISANIYGLAECLLWLWQFRNWGILRKDRWMYPVLNVALPALWVFDNFILGSIYHFNSLFALTYSFCIVLLAINQVNVLIVQEKKSLLRNAKFLICTGLIIFYTYRVMVESFYVFELAQSNRFLVNVYDILLFVNLFVNLVFALATLWIPTRQRFTMQS